MSKRARPKYPRSLIVLPPSPYPGDDAFGVLGVSPDTSIWEIKKAYIGLARQYHPDRNHSLDAQTNFIKIARAYEYIMKHGDILSLQLKCKMVEVKANYAQFLQVHKRAKVLAGIEIDPPAPKPAYIRNDELGKQMADLGFYFMMRCPFCRWKESCNRSTGYGEVEEIHHEIQSKLMSKFFGR